MCFRPPLASSLLASQHITGCFCAWSVHIGRAHLFIAPPRRPPDTCTPSCTYIYMTCQRPQVKVCGYSCPNACPNSCPKKGSHTGDDFPCMEIVPYGVWLPMHVQSAHTYTHTCTSACTYIYMTCIPFPPKQRPAGKWLYMLGIFQICVCFLCFCKSKLF
jgi:hypothetical protein